MKKMYIYLIMFTNTYFIQETLDNYVLFNYLLFYLSAKEWKIDTQKIWTLIKTEHLLGTWAKNIMSKYNEDGR